jgi:hypothetical protein
MTATITWSVTAMDAYPQAEGQTNVVFTVHWTCAGVQDTYQASVYSTCGVTYSSGTPYTPYAQLTQEQVLGWVWANGVDKEVTETAVQQQIDNQINPPVVTPKLPWITA